MRARNLRRGYRQQLERGMSELDKKHVVWRSPKLSAGSGHLPFLPPENTVLPSMWGEIKSFTGFSTASVSETIRISDSMNPSPYLSGVCASLIHASCSRQTQSLEGCFSFHLTAFVFAIPASNKEMSSFPNNQNPGDDRKGPLKAPIQTENGGPGLQRL